MKKAAMSLGLLHYDTHGHEQNIVFNNPVIVKKSRYLIRKLLLLGIIFCYHISLEAKRSALWFLLNPEMEDVLPVEQIVWAYECAVEICAIWLPMEDAKRGEERNSDAINYLYEIKDARSTFLDSEEKRLRDRI